MSLSSNNQHLNKYQVKWIWSFLIISSFIGSVILLHLLRGDVDLQGVDVHHVDVRHLEVIQHLQTIHVLIIKSLQHHASQIWSILTLHSWWATWKYLVSPLGLGKSLKSNTKVTEGGKKNKQQQARGRHGLKTVVRFNFRPEMAQK